MANEISTYKTYLMYKAAEGSTYTKLVDIVDFPDIGGEPEMIDVTTLSDPNRRYILGIQDTGAMNFTANYTHADYATIKGLKETETAYAIWFGATTAAGVDTPTGANGKFEVTGYIDVYVNGKGVNEAQTMTITIAPTSAIVDGLAT